MRVFSVAPLVDRDLGPRASALLSFISCYRMMLYVVSLRDTYRLTAAGSVMSALVEEALSLAGAALNGLSFSGSGEGARSAGETMTVRMMVPVRPVVGEVTV